MSFSELYKRFIAMNKSQIKISFEKPLYYVDAQRGFVKCNLKGVLRIPNKVAQSLGFPEDLKVASRSYAICREGDTFSDKVGVKISIAQAETNIYRNAAERLVRAWKRVNDVECDSLTEDAPTTCSVINNFVKKANGCVAHNKRYIKQIGG